jgi:ribonuclease HII
MAGPLVAAAVRFDYERVDADAVARLEDLNDSKTLSSRRRPRRTPLVSRTVRDLVAGSGLQFIDRGTRALKGIPDEWQALAATEAAPVRL